MNENVNFLLELRRSILSLYKKRDVVDALILKEFLLNNFSRLPESAETITFINALCDLCEDFSIKVIEDFYKISCDFYKSLLDSTIMDIFFVGEKAAFNDFKERINKPDHTIEFYDAADAIDYEALNKKILNSPFSLLAYDYCGSNLIFNKGLGKAFSYYLHLDKEKRERTKPISRIERWSGFLSCQYKRLKEEEHSTVIIGSSYPSYALTDVYSKHTISLSIPGLDITNASFLYYKTHDMHSVDRTIFCFGLYDMYKEIQKAKNSVYTDANKSVSEFEKSNFNDDKSEFKPVKETETLSVIVNDKSFLIDIDASVDVLISDFYFTVSNTVISSMNEHAINNESREGRILSHMQMLTCSTARESLTSSEINGRAFAIAHNNYAKYTASYDLNCNLMREIKNNAEKNKKSVYMVISPALKSYVENLHEDIKCKAFDFLSSLESEYFHFVDYSNDDDFIYSDFKDGHHLNKYGAKKLQEKMYRAGILPHEGL